MQYMTTHYIYYLYRLIYIFSLYLILSFNLELNYQAIYIPIVLVGKPKFQYLQFLEILELYKLKEITWTIETYNVKYETLTALCSHCSSLDDSSKNCRSDCCPLFLYRGLPTTATPTNSNVLFIHFPRFRFPTTTLPRLLLPFIPLIPLPPSY